MKLFFDAIVKFTLGLVLVGALLFLPAGTLTYPGAWRLMGLLFIPMIHRLITITLKAYRRATRQHVHSAQ